MAEPQGSMAAEAGPTPFEDHVLWTVGEYARGRRGKVGYSEGEVRGHRCVVLDTGFIVAMLGYETATGDVVGCALFREDVRHYGDGTLAEAMLAAALDPAPAVLDDISRTIGHALNCMFTVTPSRDEVPVRPADDELDAAFPGWRTLRDACRRLDPEVVKLTMPSDTTTATYRWLAGRDALRERRIALFARYGFAGSRMVLRTDLVDAALAEGVDGAEVVVRLLMATDACFGRAGRGRRSRARLVSAIERVGGMTDAPWHHRRAAFDTVQGFVEAGLPWDREPVSKEQSRGLGRLYAVAKGIEGIDEAGLRRLLDVPGGRYAEAWDRLRATPMARAVAAGIRVRLADEAGGDLDGFVDGNLPHNLSTEINQLPMRLAEYVIGPLDRMRGGTMGWEATMAVAMAVVVRDRSLMGIADAWDAWHRIQPQVGVAISSCAEAMSFRWDPLTDRNPVRLNGVDLLWLTTPGQLLDEGAAGPDRDGVPGMAHCVATYVAKAARGQSHIVSVRSHAGESFERMSTAEVVRDRDGSFRCVQNMGRGNTPAPMEANVAVGILMKWLGDGTLKVSAPSRQDAPERSGLGSFVGDARQVETMIRAFEPMFAAGLRGLTVENFAEAVLPRP